MKNQSPAVNGAARVALLAVLALVLGASMVFAQPASRATLCHRPPDNPDNYRTLTVGAAALADHLGHGDLLGACLDNCPAICATDTDICSVVAATPDPLTGRCVCTPGPRDCDDGEVCTADSCSSPIGCVNSPVAGCVVGSQVADILRDPTRRSESAMGNLVADVLRSSYAGVEAALVNSGGLRADLLCTPPSEGEGSCEITWTEVFRVLPFGNKSVILTLTGEQLTTALLNGVSPACNPTVATGRFPQVSGLVVEFACDGTTPAIRGMWKALGGGPLTPIQPTDSVRLATIDFLVAGGDGYSVFAEGTDTVEPGDELMRLTVAYIRANSPVGPVVEGRIVQVP